MEVIICETPEKVAAMAADFVCTAVNRKPGIVLGLATGSTPVALYRELVRRNQSGKVSFKGVTSFNLDEYVGLPPDHPQSYRYFMNEQLFNHIDIDKARTFVPDGMLANPMDAGPAYEKRISAAGGIDLQILGIGTNGHIAFNEPTSSLCSRTRVKTLTRRTVDDNSRFFKQGEYQPTMAITMGIGTVMEARQILLLATGANKAQAVAAAIEGPLSAFCPASALQMHNRTTFILDRDAASALKLGEYYAYVRGLQEDLDTRFGARA